VERAESSTIQLVPREDAGSGTRPDALPWIGDRIVARPRVTDAILDRLDRHPLLQVVAPAGAGKTTALVQAAAALELLREPVESMRRGDRTLALASALVYLAEAEWRTGAEEESDRAAAEALEVAERQGSRRELLLALADFPSVHSRRLDLGPAGESVWRSLARALVVRSEGGRGRSANGRGRIMSPVDAHLREFGEPTLVVGEAVVRPKIRKSLELLPYLLAAPSARAPREEILTALWNGRDDEPTRAYLRQALRHLRDVLPDGVEVTAAASSLALEGPVTSEGLEVDALILEAAREPDDRRLDLLLSVLGTSSGLTFFEGSEGVRWIDERRTEIGGLSRTRDASTRSSTRRLPAARRR
jgi:hypothetical protein